tara:strand:+ start:236 stop:946 length:711 start_codon:yes stop_codon:yes gene_type:complete
MLRAVPCWRGRVKNLKLSDKGNKLIKLYEEMAVTGYARTDGSKVSNAYNDFELRKFRNFCKEQISRDEIKTVLDYGGGGSDWDASGFDPATGETAKQFFRVKEVCIFEPARNLMDKSKSDCVVCMDVLEHIFVADIPNIIDELFSLTNKLLVINVACYKARALLPNGENAHITVRSPDWWKGVIDAASINYEDVEVMLICSKTFKSGVVFETFKSCDWHASAGFTTELKFQTFKPN